MGFPEGWFFFFEQADADTNPEIHPDVLGLRLISSKGVKYRSVGAAVNCHQRVFENKLTELPDSIGNLTNLTELYCYENQLTELPDSISNLINLTELCCSSNQLTELPDSMGNLTNLAMLICSNNKLS